MKSAMFNEEAMFNVKIKILANFNVLLDVVRHCFCG